jgi:ketosteroid isomerase-like protein
MLRFIGLLLCLLAVPAWAADEEAAVRAVLESQRQAWNRGDLEGYMAGYWRDERLRFASGRDVTYGWQATLQRYRQRYADRKAMGTLSFDIRDVRLAGGLAVVFGRWLLRREQDAPEGLFTLVLEKRPEGWRVIADHTS